MIRFKDQKECEKILKAKKPLRYSEYCSYEPFIYDSDFIDWLTKGGRED